MSGRSIEAIVPENEHFWSRYLQSKLWLAKDVKPLYSHYVMSASNFVLLFDKKTPSLSLAYWICFSKHTYDKYSCLAPCQQWESTCIWKPSSGKTGALLSLIVSAMAAGGLATRGARAATAIVMTKLSRNVPVSAPEVFDVLRQDGRHFCRRLLQMHFLEWKLLNFI